MYHIDTSLIFSIIITQAVAVACAHILSNDVRFIQIYRQESSLITYIMTQLTASAFTQRNIWQIRRMVRAHQLAIPLNSTAIMHLLAAH